MHPPHQPKPNESGRKITPNFGEDLFFWRPPNFGRKKRLNFRFRPKNHSQFWWRSFFFFFFFFWKSLNFGQKKRLNLRFRPKNHSQFWWRHPNFWGFVLKIPPHQNFLDPPLAVSIWLLNWNCRSFTAVNAPTHHQARKQKDPQYT